MCSWWRRRGRSTRRRSGSWQGCRLSWNGSTKSANEPGSGRGAAHRRLDLSPSGVSTISAPTPATVATATGSTLPMRSTRERLRDVLEAIERIEKYAVRGRQALASEDLLQTWVVHHLRSEEHTSELQSLRHLVC